MKQNIFSLIIVCLPLLLVAQEKAENYTSSGIKWTSGLTWQQVKEKAKKENKYIFVDCYATWCKPCKKMDKEVYTVDSVGDYLNAGFISVKLQMNVTKNDNAEVRSWYKTAREIERQYRIAAYPSYVFFAPSGEVVSKATGFEKPKGFLQIARDATDPSKQYFVLLKKYKQGKLDHANTMLLIEQAKQIGDTADYNQILNSYYVFLHKQRKEKLYTKENIEFIASTLDRSNMRLFDMFYPNGNEVNRVMQSDWYAKNVVDKIINNEMVQPFFKTALGESEPDWSTLQKAIAQKYGEDYAGRNVLNAKMLWYSGKGDGLAFTRSLNDKIEKYGYDTASPFDISFLNRSVYSIWLSVGQTTEISQEIAKELDRTCLWMESVALNGKNLTDEFTDRWDMVIDTYANLLYKAGKTEQAIKMEEQAIATLKETVKDQQTVASFAKGYETILEKMRAGEPTWPVTDEKKDQKQ